MSAVNLLPEARRDRRAARAALRSWAFAVGAWSALLLVAHAVVSEGGEPPDLARLLRENQLLAEEGGRLKTELEALEEQVVEARRSIAAARATVDHPDWSLLLAGVVAARDERLLFRRWHLARGADGGLDLSIEGTAPTVALLTEFTIRLERLGVFRRVSLGSAEVRSDARGPLVHFSIGARLTDAGAETRR